MEKLRRREAGVEEPAREAIPRSPLRETGGPFPLSFSQQRLWFIDRLEPGNTAYNLADALRLRGRLDVPALARVLSEIARRHEALRTAFEEAGGKPVQRVSPPAPVEVPVVDLADLPEPAREAEARRLAAEEARTPFDVPRGPHLRVRVLRLSGDGHAVLFTAHHIVSDGWSLGVLVREIAALYGAFSSGRPSPLPELPIQYPDFADWQRRHLAGEVLEEHLRFWREALAGAPHVLDLPADRPRPAVFTHRGAAVSTVFPRVEVGGGETLFMVLLAAFGVFLSRHAGQEDLLVASPVANRNRIETEGLIGFFVNTLPLRIDLRGAETFRDLLARVRAAALGAYAHQDLPFERIVEELQPARDLSRPPLAQVSLTLHNAPAGDLELPGLNVAPLEVAAETSQMDLSVEAVETPGGLAVSWRFNTGLFDETTVRRMAERFRVLLEGIAADPSQPLRDLPLLPASEREQVLHQWSAGPEPEGPEQCLHDLVFEQAARNPEAPALVFSGETLSYADLATRARHLARHLASLGVGPESRVGICLERSPEMVVAALAVLAAGSAYVPLDPAYPKDRLAFMAQDANLAAIVATQPTAPVLGVLGVLVVLTNREAPPRDTPLPEPPLPKPPLPNPPLPQPSPDHLAYVIYTSGSTGRPKGVLVPHRAVANTLKAARRIAPIGPGDRVLQFFSFSFDGAVMDIFHALASGACLFLARREEMLPGEGLEARLAGLGITWVTLTPSALPARPEGFPRLAQLFLGGEKLPAEAARRWSAGRRLFNAYGPTEASIFATAWEVEEGAALPAGGPPIGRPIAGARAYVLDRLGRPAPAGVPGELLLGGAGLARGYHGRPEKTAESFVPDPFSARRGERLYRTGDLVRWLPDGALEILGRIDHQVKLRGHRIEPGEIEAALAAHPDVGEAAVLLRGSAAGARLVAYAVPREPGAALPDLRAWLRTRLPEVMIPAAVVPLDSFPLTPNGKLDRGALPEPDTARRAAPEGFVPPGAGLESAVAEVWREVLGVAAVGAGDNFFELGGHSLLATQVVSRVREALGVEIPLRALFEAPTVSGLARVIEAASGGPAAELLSPVERVPGDGPFPLSFSQERLWLLEQIEPGNAAYNLAAALRFAGALRPELLAAVLGEIVRRHATLRTAYGTVDGVPVQIVHPAGPFHLPVIDLAALPCREAEARRLAGEEGLRPFDLARGPVLRASLLRLGEGDHVLLFNLHHIASDGWSTGVLVREVMALYGGSPLPELPVRYVDYAAWQRRVVRGEVLEAALGYWRERLRGVPVLELPTDRPRAASPGPGGATEPLAIPPEVSEAVKALGRRSGATLFMVLAAAFEAVLSRITNQNDFALGTPVAGRSRVELEGLIGFFVNTLVIRAGLGGDPSFAGILARVREASLGAFAHQEMPFERLVEELNPERSLSHSPLFQVMFVLQNAPGSLLKIPGLTAVPFETEGGAAKFDLSLEVADSEQGFAGGMEYRTSLFDAATIRRMLGHLEILLAGAVADPDVRLSELPLLSEAELRQVTAEWSGPRETFPVTACLHELFDRQAERAPGAVAATFEGESLTYGELRARANRVAWRLRRLGVGPESRVGLAAGRSLDLLVGLLGILKAGGAYVPLDPSYPEERLAFLLEDLGVPVLLTQEGLMERLPAYGGHVLLLDGEGFDGEGPESAADPDNAAYVIYTSGSTGVPKGTVVTHRNVARLLAATESLFGFGPGDVWTLFHSYAFDFSVWEIWGALAYGGRLVVVPYWVSRSPEAFLSLLEREGVTVLNQTPSAFRQLVAAEAGPALRFVIFGGEALEVAALAPWFDRHGDESPRLVNLYGITETTVHVTWRPVTRADLAEPHRSPIGPALPDLSVHLLDPHGYPVPAGVPGEICVGGPGLARGYLGRPDLTAARYVPNPFAPGERLYRSGDLARFRPGGEIDYLGRIDHQVKIRGFRIELGEVEAALARHRQVDEAVVLVREEAGDRRLVAYLVSKDGEPPSAEELRALLGGTLPDYMVPSAFVVLPALPLTSHGKVDRRALSEIRPEAGTGREPVPPRTPTEEVLAGLWASVLGAERVGIRDNFFDLGGHSLVATRLVARIRQVFGVEIPLRALFEGPTVEELARRVEAGEAESAPPIVPVPRDGSPLPLSFAQERLWFLDQFDPGTPTLNIPLAMRLPAAVEPGLLARALAAVVRRHEALRTAFGSEEGRPFQVIGPPFAPPLPVTDLSGLDPRAREREAARLEAEEGLLPFDLARGPLLRARLLRLGGDEWRLLLTLHHIVSDGWSVGLLTRELGAAYRAQSLPELPVQSADYAVWQRRWLSGATLDAQIAYWREKLSRPPVLDLPTDRPRPAVQTWRGAALPYTLGPGLAGRLAALARREGATLFMVLLAGFQALLARLSGQDDVVVGAPVAGRVREETEPLIGCFLNNVALRTDLSGSPSFRELLARARATALEAYAHQDVPFEKLLEELRPERDLSRTPVFQVFLNMLNFPAEEGAGGGFGDAFTPEVPAKFDLTVYAAEGGGALHLDFVYNADLFDRERVEETARQLELLLARAAEEPEARIGGLSLVTGAARAALPDPAQSLGSSWHGSIHDALARQDPDRVAVVEGGKIVTYGELAAAASGLAGLLASRGVGRGEIVAVWAHRSAALSAAVLGALRAGAAFLVLDPAYPASRLVDYLRIGRPAAFVAVAGAAPPPPEVEAELAGVACRVELPTDLPGGGPSVEAGPEDLAVITFTSGSTGRPKGVAGRHGPLTHFYPWMAERFGLSGEDRFGMLSALSHDPLQRDLFTPVWLGAALCVPDPERIGSPGYLAEWVRREGVTVLHLTPALLELLVQAGEEAGVDMPSLRRAFVVGDLLKRSDVERLYGVAPGITCINLYGSTETQRSVSCFVVPREARPGREVLPLGRGMEDAQLLVLNPEGDLAGVGELGEIHLRSAHLALGYLGDPALTAERFLPDGAGVRRYRTGDLGRYLPGGDVEFAGRVDAQVKIRGFRIEPGEIEAALARFPGVREGVVIVREDRPGDRRLVAYAVPRPGADLPPGDIRAFLAARLPGSMVPADVVILPALPLTRTGKIDRRALPAPERMAGEGAVAPRTPAEETLAGLWRELLGVPEVSVGDDFFDRGGHSLLATRLLSRIRTAFGVELPLRALFERPTIEGMAALLAESGETPAVPPLSRHPGRDEAPLSFAQQRLWFLHQLDPESPAYNMVQTLRLDGDLDEAAFEDALRELVRRQGSLRTRFVDRGTGAVQGIGPVPGVVAPVVDLSALPAGREEAERVAREEALRPFDLERGPVLRVLLLRAGPGERLLLVAMHHIVSDGWSLGVFVREAAALYAAFALGRPSPLPELPVRYTDYAVWQREAFGEEGLASAIEFWRRRLAGVPVLELPTDRPRSAAPGARGAREGMEIGSAAGRALLALARGQGATLFMGLAAAFEALLSRMSGQTDLAVGTPVAGRERTELEPLIGFFVNTLVLRGDLSGDPPFRELLGRTRSTALEAFAHQQVPFEKLVEEINPERSLFHTPLFQAVLVLQNAPAATLEAPGLALRPVDTGSVTAKFDLTLTAVELEPDGALWVSLEYRTGLFDAPTIRRMLGHFANLVEGAAAEPDLRLSELPLLSGSELRQVTAEWAGPRAAFPVTACLHELFARQAEARPGAVAAVFEEASLTYGELHARSNRLARRLRRLGVGPEARVGLAAERSLDLLVGILGILKAGGAYVPLDPSYPGERLAFLLEDAFRGLPGPVLVTQAHLLETLPAHRGPVLLLDREEEAESSGPVDSGTVPENAAYVFYTSGSTGRPKGTVVTHGNVVRLFAAIEGGLGFGPEDVWTLFHSFAFDFSVWEIWGALLHGGRLVVVPYLVSREPEAFLALLARERVTLLSQTPSAFRQLAAAEAESSAGLDLRAVIFGGEALDLASLSPWLDRHGDLRPLLANLYGITETTVHVTWRPVRRADLAEPWRSPIGVPIPDLSVHLLDPNGRPVPIGVPGEIHVGGAGLARGYLGRPDLTAERYVPNPFAGPGERMYRSGDLARFRPDGEIDYLGRIDQQVKVRGFRIEPAEVEAVLSGHPEVREAAVLLVGEGDGRRLVAYVGTGEAEAPGLRAFAAERLPDYMVPAAFVILPALPLTPHGKVDRRALAGLRPSAGAREPLPPRTLAEAALAGLWRELLGVEEVGVEDNFFDLGGHSLLATRLLSRIRAAFGVEVPLRALFERPTIEGMAGLLAAGEAASAPPLVARPWADDPPLSFAQERLWFLHQLDPGSPVYNLHQALRLDGGLDEAALEASLRQVVRRQEVLRTRFVTRGLRAVQVIGPVPDAMMPVVDLAALPGALRASEGERIAHEESLRPFDLECGPVLRVLLLRLAPEERLLSVAMHHIATDGWSMDVFVHELTTLYRAFAAGQPSPLPALPVRYADFAAWQREWLAGPVLSREAAWWRERLAGAPAVLDLPLDLPRPPLLTFRGGRLARRMPAEAAEALLRLGREREATPFMTLLALFAALLLRHTGQEDVVVGSPVANRNRRETEGLIGFFVNTLVLRTDLSGAPGFRALVDRVRETALGAYTHQDLPFEKLVEEIAPERSLRHTPLFQALFVLRSASHAGGPSLSVESGTAKFDLTMAAEEGPGLLHVAFDYNADLFFPTTIHRLLAHCEALLSGVAAEPDRPVSEIPLLSAAEEHQLLTEWNAAPAGPAEDASLHQLFFARAAERPEAPALLSDEGAVTYRELAARALRLARRLKERGVGPEVTVGLLADRSPAMIAGLLGILAAGGVYVPLDPSWPRERLAFVPEDAGARLVLTREDLDGLEGDPLDPAGVRVEPDHAAYVIYTSGSTGTPNGVVIPHRGAVNLLRQAREHFGTGPGSRVLQAASPGFDASILEIFLALGSGGALVQVREEERLTPVVLAERLNALGVTTLMVTPAFLSILPEPALKAVETVGVGGEDCPAPLAARWSPGRRFLNCYGPTEVSIYVTVEIGAGREEGEPPIGRPVAGVEAFLLDADLQPVPLGVAGELCLGGVGLARGYLGQPGKTAAKFIPHPFVADSPSPGEGERGGGRGGQGVRAGEGGARLYRTGDLSRFRPDGRLEFLGRIDRQVKVRGVRIELGEIEAALAAHRQVEAAAVVAHGEGADRFLAAYAVLSEPAPSPAELRRFLAGSLPAALVPAVVVPLPALPLTSSGKVDRRALPVPGAPRPGREAVPPRNAVERLLADLWQSVLGTSGIGVHDDFFELGGSSIKAAILANALEERLGVPFFVVALFEAPTIARLAVWLEAHAPVAGKRIGEARILVPLKTGGPGLPFFCVHPAGGNALCYAELAREIAPDRPFYGLQSVGLGDREPQETVEEMAATYIAEILAVQPAGPYLLGGWSLGGVVAYEMAQRLRERGEEVALLVLIDTVVPGRLPEEERPPREEDADFLLQPIVAELEPAAGESLLAEAAKLAGLPPEERLEGALRIAQQAGYLPADLGIEQVRRLIRVYHVNGEAWWRYRPAPYPGRALLLRATEGPVKQNPSLEWHGLLTGEWETADVPGTHQALMAQPAVHVVAGLLRDRLRGVDE